MNNTCRRVALNESDHLLIDFLARHRQCSRNKAKALLDRRLVFVNGRRIWMARHRLQAGDSIEIADIPPGPGPDTAHILFQDSDYLITDKPAGILTNGPHSLEAQLQTTLNITTLTACHRLDRGTSGCLLFALHTAAQQRILPLFSSQKIQKIYHALVSGMITKTSFAITKPLEGQPAATHIQVLNANREASHLRIVIQTGRTHQIRKHLLSIGHPILGEPYYAPRREVSPIERRILRPMLHAFRLSFIQPISGAAIRCTAPLPGDFRQRLAWFHLR